MQLHGQVCVFVFLSFPFTYYLISCAKPKWCNNIGTEELYKYRSCENTSYTVNCKLKMSAFQCNDWWFLFCLLHSVVQASIKFLIKGYIYRKGEHLENWVHLMSTFINPCVITIYNHDLGSVGLWVIRHLVRGFFWWSLIELDDMLVVTLRAWMAEIFVFSYLPNLVLGGSLLPMKKI